MHHARTTPFLAAIVCASAALESRSAAVEDWPQFRGPHRNGITADSDWVVEGKPESVWSKNVGLGYSGTSVKDGRLFTLGFDEAAGEDVLYALDALTGEPAWTHRYSADIWARSHGGGTLSTPSIDGDLAYFSDREGKFFCFRAATGEKVWSKDLKQEFPTEYPRWGFAAAPLVLEDTVVMNVNRVVAFNKQTGDVVWKTQRDYGDSYSTPVPFDLDGLACLAVFNKTGLVVLDRADGSQLHLHEWPTRVDVNAAAPIIVGGNRVFISSGYNHGCALLDLSGPAPKVVWENKVMRNHMNASTLWEGHLYGFDENTFKCVDLSGNERWRERGLGEGAHIIADGKIIALTAAGELVITEANPERFAELWRAKVLDNAEGAQCWTTPVLVDGLIYCRNSRGQLVCRDHRPAGAPVP